MVELGKKINPWKQCSIESLKLKKPALGGISEALLTAQGKSHTVQNPS